MKRIILTDYESKCFSVLAKAGEHYTEVFQSVEQATEHLRGRFGRNVEIIDKTTRNETKEF